jgi:hypothetical protein
LGLCRPVPYSEGGQGPESPEGGQDSPYPAVRLLQNLATPGGRVAGLPRYRLCPATMVPMSILLGLLPFLVCFVLMRLVGPTAGLIAAFVASLALSLRMLWRNESVKIFEIGSLILFAVLVTYTVLAAPRWTVASVRLAVDGELLGIVVVSLAIGRPFTLQYARERVPEQFWVSPIFLSTNRKITLVWAMTFAVLVAADGAAEYVAAIPLWVDITASIVAFVGAVWFSRWYPNVVRRRIARATDERRV